MSNKIIDFHATWCGPCKIQKPILEKFAKENNIEIEYVDIEEDYETAKKYNVRAVPTLVFLKNGVVSQTLVGLQLEQALKTKIAV